MRTSLCRGQRLSPRSASLSAATTPRAMILAMVVAMALSGCGGDDTKPLSLDAGATQDVSDANVGDAGVDAAQVDAAPVDAAAEFPLHSCAAFAKPCVELRAGDVEGLQEATQLLEKDTTLVLGAGAWHLDNQVTLRKATGITLIGQGIDKTILNFKAQKIQSNGVDVIGDNFRIESLTIEDAKKDALRIEDSKGVTIRKVKVTWTNGPAKENGAYGLYPVKCQDVLIEDSVALNASDAGLYVGQTRNVIVRNNVARGNVAGIEIENTQFADVYGNLAEDNTVGLAVFDLPGNPIIGRDIYVHDNIVKNNNRANFAPGGTVSEVPAGTGTFIMASRRVEFAKNTYENNGTVDIAVVSGLAIQNKASKWRLAKDKVVGDSAGLDLPNDATGISNYRTSDVYLHDNTHKGSGTNPDGNDPWKRPLGFLLLIVYDGATIENVLYDAWGESSFHATDAGKNSNDNRLCLDNEAGATFVSINLPVTLPAAEEGKFAKLTDFFRPKAPFAPFTCKTMKGGPLAPVVLPQLKK